MKYTNTLLYIVVGMIFCFSLGYLLFYAEDVMNHGPHWKFQSIDTMKYSRDLAREKLPDSSFDVVIDKQMKNIAETGATHVGIATPYDDEFLPILKRWVSSARKHGLHVWFRGNFSGWEQWFNYPKLDSAQHIELTKHFIHNNPDLFEDGDVFTSCPECENGAKPDLGNQDQIQSHRLFLLAEYEATKEAFVGINKHVTTNYYSMNYDIATALMDPETTRRFDGVVVIDHYVESPEQLASDVKKLAEKSGGRIVLGEIGAPIPDIHGSMNENAQKQWIQRSLELLATIPEVEGVSYWVNTGGSTELWKTNGQSKPAVSEITSFYGGEK